ncbi:hypothetical protein Peur_035478 [Populus x canadensis]
MFVLSGPLIHAIGSYLSHRNLMIAQISCLVLNGKGLVTTSTSPALTCSCIRSQNDQAQACWICTSTTLLSTWKTSLKCQWTAGIFSEKQWTLVLIKALSNSECY